MNDAFAYIILALLVLFSTGWLLFGDKIRFWMNSVIS